MAHTSPKEDGHQILDYKKLCTTKLAVFNIKYSPNSRTIVGKGLSSIVYPGYHCGKYVPVAVKLVETENLEKETELKDFKIWAQNNDNNYVVQLYDYYIDPELGHFLVMELAVRTFKEQIEKYNSDINEIIKWLYQVSTGLEYIHGKRGIHGEIKPVNILMILQNGKLVAKLADFGVKRKIPGVERSETKDIYELGKTIYFALSKGVYCPSASGNHDPNQLSIDHVAGNDLVMRMTAIKPEKRPNIKQVLSHCLFWDWEKEQKFLVRAAICSSNEDCVKINTQTDAKYKEYFHKGNPGKQFNWILSGKDNGLDIPELYFTSKKRKKPTNEYGDGESITKFLKFFRDKYVHYPDMKSDGIFKFSDNDGAFCEEKYVKILTSICPSLTVFLYTGLSLNLNVTTFLPISRIYFPLKLKTSDQQTSTAGTNIKDGMAAMSMNNFNQTPNVPCREIIGKRRRLGRRDSDILEDMYGLNLQCTINRQPPRVCRSCLRTSLLRRNE